jgi:hypothetical protein
VTLDLNPELDDVDDDDDCMCEYPATCGGTGVRTCDGCGGDLCVCICGGEWPCPGCVACPDEDDFGDEDDA